MAAQEDNPLRIVDASKAFQAGTGGITNACRAKAPFVPFRGRSGLVPRQVMLIAILLAGLVVWRACGSGSTSVPSPQGSALLTLSASSLNFGPVPVGTKSAAQFLTIMSTGNAQGTIQSITPSIAGFAWSGPALPLVIASMQSVQLSFTFQPTSPGAVSGTLSITTNASNSPLSIALSGFGTTPLISLGPSSLDFGNETVNTASVNQSVTVGNQGGLPLVVSQVRLMPLQFRLSGPAPPFTILPGNSVTYGVSFAPDAAKSFSGSLTITSNAYNGAATTSFSGTGVVAPSVLNVAPTSLNFGNQVINTTSPALSVSLWNGGSNPLTISDVQATSPFVVRGFSGSVTLNPAQSLTLGVALSPSAQTNYSGSLTILSSAPSSPNVVSLGGTGVTAPLCGKPDDRLVHIPPSYTLPLAPPVGIGQTLVDPQYGCTITRLTTFGEFQAGQANHLNYSTITPLNANGSKVMLFLDNGSAVIVDTQGNVVVPIANMPAMNTQNDPWDPTNPAVFYFTNSNQFLKGTISGSTVATTVLHTFTGYTSVLAPDQEDLSDDGCKYWLVGTPSAGGSPVGILYNLCTDTVVSQSLVVGVKDSATGWHKIQIFPSGKMLMTWNSNGTTNGTGGEIYNTDGTLYWHLYDQTAHNDVGTDLAGREVVIGTPNGKLSMNACANAWLSLTVVDINAKAPVNCLINNVPAWHVSYRDSPKGWVLLSVFDQGTCPDFSCFTLPSNWQSIWPLYGEELLLVKIDGTAVYRLAHHRSRSAEAYWAQPRAAISRDGKYVLWDSNFDISSTGDANYSDVYLTRIQ